MKSENLIDNGECVITGNIVNRNEEMLLNDTTKEKTRIELNREYFAKIEGKPDDYKENSITKEENNTGLMHMINKDFNKIHLDNEYYVNNNNNNNNKNLFENSHKEEDLIIEEGLGLKFDVLNNDCQIKINYNLDFVERKKKFHIHPIVDYKYRN